MKKITDIQFDDDEKKAFYALKLGLYYKPILSIYNKKSDTEIHADAGIYGFVYTCILFQ